MRGEHLREVFETVLPDDELMQLANESGLQTRQRKLDAVRFLRSMVIAAATRYGGRQADVARVYFEERTEPVVRGGFYRWFGPALERCMEGCRNRALAYARRQPRDLPGVLGREVSDWHIVDSTTVKLDDALKNEYPGTGDYAALKVHKRFSVGVGTTIDYHLSPAREHDAPHLEVDASWMGLGLLVDLGYASHALLRDCETHDVRYVLRLKEGWKPKVERVVKGTTIMGFARGTDLDLLLGFSVLKLDGKPIDADVVVGDDIHCRLVGIDVPKKGYCFYLTNLSRQTGPKQVADLYRVRWEIESDNKLDKSCHSLADIGAKKASVVRALVHASIVSSVMICLLAHHHRLEEAGPPRRGSDRKQAPIHPQTLALVVGHAGMRIAMAMEEDTADTWDWLAKSFEHQGKDPNWRRRPSVLDELRGWRVQPGRRKAARTKSGVAN